MHIPSHSSGGSAVRVLFVVTAASIWPSQKPVWEACSRDPRFLVRVVLAVNRYVDRQSKEFHQARAMLIANDVPFAYAYEGVLDDLKPDVGFLPAPYTDMLPVYLREEAFEMAGVRIAYIPYGLEIGGGAFNIRYQFNLPLHNRAWRIFARSVSHRRMFARYCSAGDGHVAVVGSTRLDELSRLDACDASALEARIKGRKAILWTPHFSEGSEPAWSSFDRYRDHILDLFARLTETHVLILRPHPLLFSHLQRMNYWTARQAEAFYRRVVAAENVILDESSAYLPAFKVADGLMADAGSFLLEFFATGKPLLYLSPRNGMGLNDDAHLTDHLYVCHDGLDITRFVNAVELGEDPMGEQRRAALSSFFHLPEGGSVGQTIADQIATAVRLGDDMRRRPIQQAEEQAAARAYWVAASKAQRPPPAVYERQEAVFTEILAKFGPWSTAADVGAGDGRCTVLLSSHADQVTACDVSEALLQQARERSAREGVGNIEWRLEGLDEVHTLSRYDLTCCLNVLSTFVDVQAYAAAISTLRAMTHLHGLVITLETLSLREQKMVRDQASGFAAVRRNEADYLDSFAQQGFELVEKTLVRKDSRKGLQDAFFVFRMS